MTPQEKIEEARKVLSDMSKAYDIYEQQEKNKHIGFNQALHLCRLAYLKMIPSEEEIMRILQIGILPTAIARDDTSKIFKDGVNVKTLATALHKLLKERMGC